MAGWALWYAAAAGKAQIQLWSCLRKLTQNSKIVQKGLGEIFNLFQPGRAKVRVDGLPFGARASSQLLRAVSRSLARGGGATRRLKRAGVNPVAAAADSRWCAPGDRLPASRAADCLSPSRGVGNRAGAFPASRNATALRKARRRASKTDSPFQGEIDKGGRKPAGRRRLERGYVLGHVADVRVLRCRVAQQQRHGHVCMVERHPESAQPSGKSFSGEDIGLGEYD